MLSHRAVVAVGSDQRVTYAWTTGEVTTLSKVPALRNVVDGIGGTGTARTEETPTLERRYKPSGEKTKDPTERAANTADANIDDVKLKLNPRLSDDRNAKTVPTTLWNGRHTTGGHDTENIEGERTVTTVFRTHHKYV